MIVKKTVSIEINHVAIGSELAHESNLTQADFFNAFASSLYELKRPEREAQLSAMIESLGSRAKELLVDMAEIAEAMGI